MGLAYIEKAECKIKAKISLRILPVIRNGVERAHVHKHFLSGMMIFLKILSP